MNQKGLQTLFGFVTGLDTIPSLGFEPSPRLRFHHPNPAVNFCNVFTNAYIDVTNECHAAYFQILLLFRVFF